MHCRFVDVTDTELTQFLEEQENPNTKRKTAFIESFRCFIQTVIHADLLSSELHPSIHKLSPTATSLNKLLSKFINGVRKKDGSEYEPTNLRGFLSSIQRYLWLHYFQNQRCSVQSFNGYAQTKQKDLKAKGFGNKPRVSNDRG